MDHDVPARRMLAALSFLATAPSGFVPRGLLAGLRLEADDLDWAHGAGPVVRSDSRTLLLACTGRSVALEALTGDGAPLLRARLTNPGPDR